MTIPRKFQNQPKRAMMKNGIEYTIEWLGECHYLLWLNCEPLTEVQAVPEGSNNWYWTGSEPHSAATMGHAITLGIADARKPGRHMGEHGPGGRKHQSTRKKN